MPDRSGQLDLFGGPPPRVAPATPAPELTELAAAMPPGLRMGTSSWSFPGWRGAVYRDEHDATTLARDGLSAYAAHPLLGAVGVDRAYYGPIAEATWRSWAAAVPAGFQFLVKAYEGTTLPRYPDHARYGRRRGSMSREFLDAAYTADAVVAPVLDALGGRPCVFLFQFSPGALLGFLDRHRLPAALHRFFGALPRAGRYAVELRDSELLTADYGAAIADAGAAHCVNVMPGMPDPWSQWGVVGGAGLRTPLVVRWMLARRLRYQEAREAWQPFDRIREPDLGTRVALAELIADVAGQGRQALVIANNKAEGCSPLSVVELARAVQGSSSQTPASP